MTASYEGLDEVAFSDREEAQIEDVVGAFIERRRPPPHLRKDLDLGYRISGQSVVIFELRPRWQHREAKIELKIAKATLVRSISAWRVYWQRGDGKWRLLEPTSQVAALEEFVALLDANVHGVFFG